MSFLNTGVVISRTPLPGGKLSVFELEVRENAPAAEHVLAKLPLPQQCLIAAVVQREEAYVPGAGDRLRPGDTAIAIIADAQVEEALQQFQTS